MLECLYTAFGFHRQRDALFGVIMLQLFWNTPKKVIEATLLANLSTKVIYHIVYP